MSISPSAGCKAKRGLFRILVFVAGAALSGHAFAAAQQSEASDLLRIAVSESGRPVFDGLIPDLASYAGASVRVDVKYSSALAAMRDFCRASRHGSPDILLTTWRMRDALADECNRNGVEHIVGVELGRGALVLAVRAGSAPTKLSTREVYLALARDVPDKDEFRRNTAIRWSDINKSLPAQDIRFQIPPRDDGTRALFDALILESGCRHEPTVQLIFSADQRTARCVTARVDRMREIPTNQAVRELLAAPEGTVGVLSYFDLMHSDGKLQAIALDGVMPTHNAILQGEYDNASPYWLYAKRGQALRGAPQAVDAAVDRMVARSFGEAVIGPNGIATSLGLIPLPDADREAQRALLTGRGDNYGAEAAMNLANAASSDIEQLLALAVGSAGLKGTAGEQTFTSLMDLAGYKTQEFQTSVSLIPGAGMTFGIVREMSEADEDHLERELAHDAHARIGFIPALQRWVVRSVLNVSETNDYEISSVDIELLPLPSMKLVVSPTDAPISSDTSTIMRAIERLNDRISEFAQ